MLSYRHGFHAGNFADVFKHLALVMLVRALARKDKPFCYLDTHAGAGRYDLASVMAKKNREFEGGIERLRDAEDLPAAARLYMEAVRAFNSGSSLRFYPGSPRLVRHFLRPRDRMILCELHGTETEALQKEFAGDRQAAVHPIDGYQGLKAFLPPLERRGLVLIDPAYELQNERARALEALISAWKRWPTGVFAWWRPLQDGPTEDWLHRQLKKCGIPSILATELRIRDETSSLSMNGVGMILVNPPWRLDEELEQVGPWLWKRLSLDEEGGFRMEWAARPLDKA
jgi:23S rRNA (adenine2030-N6)-methyltransferase